MLIVTLTEVKGLALKVQSEIFRSFLPRDNKVGIIMRKSNW
jgi:hypothetical protein